MRLWRLFNQHGVPEMTIAAMQPVADIPTTVVFFKALEILALGFLAAICIAGVLFVVAVLMPIMRAGSDEDDDLGIDETHGDVPHMPQHMHDEKDVA